MSENFTNILPLTNMSQVRKQFFNFEKHFSGTEYRLVVANVLYSNNILTVRCVSFAYVLFCNSMSITMYVCDISHEHSSFNWIIVVCSYTKISYKVSPKNLKKLMKICRFQNLGPFSLD
jgi:hypothetical protein